MYTHQSESWWTNNCVILNTSDISTEVEPLCSLHRAAFSEPDFHLLGPALTKLGYLNMLHILEVARYAYI